MSEPADVVIIQQPPAAKVVIAAEGVSPTGGGVTEVSAADATITVAGTPDHPTLKVSPGSFVSTLTQVTGSVNGLTIQLMTGATGQAIQWLDHTGAPIGQVGATGGLVIQGDRVQAAPGVFGPWMAVDGTTNPPSILGPSSTYGNGQRVYMWPGTPAAGWVAGTTNVNDKWINFATGETYRCTVSGAGSAAGTWVADTSPSNTVTAASNAGTVPVLSSNNKFTNTSAAAMTITMATAGAVDGQQSTVRVYDFSGVAETINWVNTESGGVTPPSTSNGSTTLPTMAVFMFNGATSKWRCIGSAGYTDAAVAVETARAEAAEALLLPKSGGTMSGAIAMGAHKVTGLTNGSASDDAAAFGQIPAALPPNGSAGGDLSGTFPSPTVAKIQSVAISAAIATLLSQLNGAGTLAASGTLVAGAWTELTGTTASQTATLPASTAQASSVNVIQNNSTQVWTIAPGASTTLLYNTTSGGFLLAPNCSITVVLIGTVWVIVAYSGIGQQTAGTAITANWATQLAGTSAWQQAATGTGSTGTAPSITLPNDNRIYSVECIGSLWKVGTANDIVGLGLGTSTSVILASAVAALSATGAALPPIVAQAVTGTGQTINMYAQNATGNGASHILTVQAAASGAANLTSPSVITATRVG